MDPVVRHIIAGFRKSPNWDEELDLQLMQKLWPAIVGEKLAAATSVVALRGSGVVLNVPNQIWRRQLMTLKPVLLAKINEVWIGPRIADIAFTYEN